MNQTIYEQNLQFLGERHEIAKEFEEKLSEISQAAFPVETFTTSDGHLGMYQNRGEEGIVQFNSKYNAGGYADIWADGVIRENKPGFRSTLFVFGLGSGIYLKKLLERITRDTYIFVYEPSKEAFVKLLHETAIEKLWQDNVLIIVKGYNDIMFRSFFECFIRIDNQNLEKLLSIPNYSRLYAEDYMWFYHEIQRCNNLITVNMNTYIDFARDNTRNQIGLLPYFINSYSLADYVLKLPMQMPAIIVGAGPSLEKNVHELKRAKGKALIISIDSSVKILLKEGIVPDINFTIDARKPLSVFEGEEVSKIPLCLSGMARMEAAESQKGKLLFSGEDGYVKSLMNEYGKQRIELLSGGTVTQSAFSMALLAKLNPIILVGQDLAYTDDMTHAHGSHRTDVQVNEKDCEGDAWVEDINGNMLRTAPNMLLYKKWFEERIVQYPDVEVINATEGGAKIEGAQVRRLCDVIDEVCTSTADYDIIMDGVQPLFNEEEKHRLYKSFHDIPGILSEVKEKTLEGRAKYEQIMEMAKEEQIDMEQLHIYLEEIGQITAFVEEKKETELIIPMVKQAERQLLTGMASEDEDPRKDLENVARRGKLMYEATIDAVDYVMPLLDDMLCRLDGMYHDFSD